MKTVYAKASFEGIHRWLDAPDEVKYLRNPHRHIFNVKVSVEVTQNDREIEFIMLGHRVKELFEGLAIEGRNGVWYMGTKSCEDVAEMVMDYIRYKLGLPDKTYIAVQVDEDGENGCIVTS